MCARKENAHVTEGCQNRGIRTVVERTGEGREVGSLCRLDILTSIDDKEISDYCSY